MWDPIDRAGTPNDCAKPAEPWIFTSGSSDAHFWEFSLVTNGPAIGHFINPGITNSIHNDVLLIVITIPSSAGHEEAATSALTA